MLCVMLDSSRAHAQEQRKDYNAATTPGRVTVSGAVDYVPRISQDITVTVVQLSSGNRFRINLRAGLDYEGVIQEALSVCGIPYRETGELRFYYTSRDDWAYELNRAALLATDLRSAPSSSSKYVTVADLKESSTIYIAALRDNIGPRQRLQVIAADNQYNASIQLKIAELEGTYEGWRSIRGDGNCFYRAVIVGLLEQIVRSGNRAAFDRLRRKFEEVDTKQFTFATYEADHRDMLRRLQEAASGSAWRTVSELEADILTKQPSTDKSSIDHALIRACRAIVSTFLKRNQDQDMTGSGLSIKDAILPSHPECSSMEEYCRRYVDAMGEDAQGAFVYLGLLQSSLQCAGVTVILDNRAEVKTNILETSPLEAGSAAIATIHLLLRPGHYDLLYTRI
jgi:ubiquitin thioesterase protein OTUB1